MATVPYPHAHRDITPVSLLGTRNGAREYHISWHFQLSSEHRRAAPKRESFRRPSKRLRLSKTVRNLSARLLFFFVRPILFFKGTYQTFWRVGGLLVWKPSSSQQQCSAAEETDQHGPTAGPAQQQLRLWPAPASGNKSKSVKVPHSINIAPNSKVHSKYGCVCVTMRGRGGSNKARKHNWHNEHSGTPARPRDARECPGHWKSGMTTIELELLQLCAMFAGIWAV